MIKPKLRHLPLAAAALVACAGAHAGYQSPDGSFLLSGFGTLGAVHSSTNDVQFNYPGQGGGAGTQWSANPDSKLALQGTYKLAPTFSATAQIMSKFNPNHEYTPDVDWAFVKWQAAPSVNFRLGRMGAPFFMVSDFRNVGYANTTVRPNLDVYGQVPTDRMEGVDASYQYNLGSTTLNATIFAGKAEDDYTSALRKGPLELGPSHFEMGRLKGINLTAETENGLTLRAGYVKSKFTIGSDSINAMQSAASCLKAASAGSGGSNLCLPQVSPLLPTTLDALTAGGLNAYGALFANAVNGSAVTNNRNVSFTGFGATYDQDNWIISAEYTKRRSDNFVADTTGWYANAGYRVGKFTPFVGLSRLSVDSYNVSQTLLPTTGPFAGLAALGNGLNASLKSFMDVEHLAQHTYTVGSRWDIMPNVALKAQWDQIHKPADAWGLFFTPDPSTAQAQSFLHNRRKVNVLSVSMDVVF